MELEFQIALASESEYATTASSWSLSICSESKMGKRMESGKHSSSIKEQIELQNVIGTNWRSQILKSTQNGLNPSRLTSVLVWCGWAPSLQRVDKLSSSLPRSLKVIQMIMSRIGDKDMSGCSRCSRRAPCCATCNPSGPMDTWSGGSRICNELCLKNLQRINTDVNKHVQLY